jgi:hypothetical protein
MKITKLTNSQKSLFRAWTDDYQRIMGVIGAMLQDNLNLRLEKIAVELGIDLENENWNFDQQKLEFIKVEPKAEGAPAGPSFLGGPEADSIDVPVGTPEEADAVDSPEAV